MKRHPPTAFSADLWSELEGVFWRHPVPCMPKGSACDGLDPVAIETTKLGVEVRGGIWFLVGGPGSPSPRFELNLCLSRPRFSSMESVSISKLRTATVSDSTLENGLVSITLT